VRYSPVRALLAAVWLGIAFGSALQAAPPSDSLLPPSTKGYISIPRVQTLVDSFQETQLGRLLDDPVMKPFGDDIRRQIKEKWSQSHSKLGMSLEDLEGIATGELSLAVVAAESGSKASLAVLVDVSGQEEKAQETLDKVYSELQKQGAKRSQKDVAGVKLTILETPPKGEQKEPNRAVYFLKDGLFGASDQISVASEIAKKLAGGKGDSLAKVKAYQAVIERCESDQAVKEEPQVRWFLEPMGFADAMRTWQDHRRKGGADYLEVVKKQGFGAIKGIGGFVNFSAGSYGVLHRTAAYAPPPYELAMRMMVFPNGGEFTPQDWVTSDLATYASVRCDLLNAFDRFDTLFDEIYGEKGVWVDTLDSVKTDPNGPKIDIREDLVKHLGQRATIVTDYTLPITPTSQRKLVAIEAKNEKALADAVQKSMQGDPRVKERQIGEHTIWELLAEDEPQLELDIEGPGANEKKPAAEAGVGPGGTPNSAVTVAKGHLFVSSHISLLEKILEQKEDQPRRDALGDYRLVVAEFGKLGANEICAQGFAKTDEQHMATYELFRAGQLPEADTFFAKFLNLLLGEEKEGVTRKPRLDGSKLPPFEKVRHYLGAAGSFVTSEPNGWYIVGFTLNKQTPLANGLSPTETTKK
jgi:hypothetical protein